MSPRNRIEPSNEGFTFELRKLVLESLGNHVRSLSIEVAAPGLILSGNCDSYHAKQMVQEIVARSTSMTISSNDLLVDPCPSEPMPKRQ